MLRRAARRGGCGRVRGQGRYCCRCRCRYCYGYCYRSHCGCGPPVGSDPTVPEGRLSHGGGWDIQARCEMRDAREREPAGAARRRPNEIHGRRWATRWRSGGPGMRLPSRLDLRSAGGRKACRDRDRLPGSWQRALLSGPQKDLGKLVAPVQSSSTASATASGAAMPAKLWPPISDLWPGQHHSTASVSWFGRGGDLVQLADRLWSGASSSAWRGEEGVRSISAKERGHGMPGRPSTRCCPSPLARGWVFQPA